MRGRSVERSPRSREEPFEAARRRHHGGFGGAGDVQTRAAQQVEAAGFACGNLGRLEGLSIPVGGSIDQDEEALGAAGKGAPIVAVLSADVDGGAERNLAVVEELAELFLVVRGEEDVVPREGKAARLGDQGPGDRRQRSLARLSVSLRRGLAEEPSSQRRGVAVEHHGVRSEDLAAGEPHARRAPVLDQDLLDLRVDADLPARALEEAGERRGDLVHAAFDEPHAVALDMRDDIERGRREERRRSAVRRVAAEELAQALVLEEITEGLPEGAVTVDVEQGRDADLLRHAERGRERGPVRSQERPLDRPVDPARVPAEAPVALRLGPPGEVADRVGGSIDVGEQIELLQRPAVWRPGMACEEVGRRQLEMFVQGCAEGGEDLLEHPAHRQDGRPRVHSAPRGVNLAHLASHTRSTFEEKDFCATTCKQRGGDQAAHPSAHDDNAFVPHDVLYNVQGHPCP